MLKNMPLCQHMAQVLYDHVTREGYHNLKPEPFYDTDFLFKLGPVLLFFSFWLEYLISGQKSYHDFREMGPLCTRCENVFDRSVETATVFPRINLICHNFLNVLLSVMLFKACFCDAGGSQENWQEIPSSTGNMSVFNSGEIPRADLENSERGGT